MENPMENEMETGVMMGLSVFCKHHTGQVPDLQA